MNATPETQKNPDLIVKNSEKPSPGLKTTDNQPNSLKRLGNYLHRGVITLPVAATLLAAACAPGGRQNVESPTSVVFTPGENVVHATETPIPSQTATVESMITKTAETTKTAQPSETPEATATAETDRARYGYQIELDDQMKALQAEGKPLPSGLKVEQYTQKITEELNKFPKVGNLKVKLYFPTQESIDSGQANDYFLGLENGGPKILLRADHRGDAEATLSLAELDHEVGHYFSNSANGEYWKTILTPEEYEEAKQIEENASHDLNWGLADYQDFFAEYFSDKMKGGTEYPQADATVEEQMACSRKRMLEIFLSGLNSEADKTPNPFMLQIQTQLNEIHTYANSPEMLQKVDYIADAIPTLDRNQAMVDKLSENPLMAQVYKSIRENGAVLTQQNMARTSSASDTFKMTGFTKGEAFENLSVAAAKIFLEREYLAGNPTVVEAFKGQGEVIKQFRINKEIKARKEGPADQMKVQERVTGANTPAGGLLTFYSNVAVRLSR
ncbi:MAG: hypothetical protein AAB512_03765 [Patescibacteria group bacterium]